MFLQPESGETLTDYYHHIKTIAGLDVAAARDFSVLSLVESWDLMRTDPFGPTRPVSREFRLVYQERFQGDYPSQVDTICRKLDNYTQSQRQEPVKPAISKILIVETNGIGQALYDSLKKKIPSGWIVYGALLTVGDSVTKVNGIWHLNKREIINCLTHELDQGTIRIPEDLLTKDLLLHEAAGFIRTFTATGKEQLNSDTEARHDDLIISLAYAIWYSVSRGEIRLFTPAETALLRDGF